MQRNYTFGPVVEAATLKWYFSVLKYKKTVPKRWVSVYLLPLLIYQFLNSALRALLTIIFSGVSTKRCMANLPSNHTVRWDTALCATMNCRFALKNRSGSSWLKKSSSEVSMVYSCLLKQLITAFLFSAYTNAISSDETGMSLSLKGIRKLFLYALSFWLMLLNN